MDKTIIDHLGQITKGMTQKERTAFLTNFESEIKSAADRALSKTRPGRDEYREAIKARLREAGAVRMTEAGLPLANAGLADTLLRQERQSAHRAGKSLPSTNELIQEITAEMWGEAHPEPEGEE